MPRSVVRPEQVQPPKPLALVSAGATPKRSALKENHQARRASFPRKRESIVVGRRSGNMDARFRGHDAELGLPKMPNALTRRRSAGGSHPIEESGDGE